jgi:hypothetical protein
MDLPAKMKLGREILWVTGLTVTWGTVEVGV